MIRLARSWRFAALPLWLGALVSLTLVLIRAGGAIRTPPPSLHANDIVTWLTTTPTAMVTFALVRLVGFALCAYLGSVTVLQLAAKLSRLPCVARTADLATAPGLRPLLRGILGAGLVASTALSVPATAWADRGASSGVATMHLLDEPASGPSSGSGHLATMHPLDEPPPAAPTTTEVAMPEATQPIVEQPDAPQALPASSTWTIEPGDHLWRVSTVTLTRALGRPPSIAETAEYLTLLIAANRDVLAVPGNPDLVFAGQVFALPSP